MKKFKLKTDVNKLSGIYKITSPTKKVYIGQSVDVYIRMMTYQRNVPYSQRKLHNSINKHGINKHTFEVLEYCNVELLNEKERYYQDLYSAIGKNGLNLVLTTASDRSGFVSEETKEKKRLSMLGRKHSPETIQKLKNVIVTDLARQNMSKSQKNKCRSIIERQRKTLSENVENSNRLREFNKKVSIKVKCLDRFTNNTIGVYESIREASRVTGVDRKCISLSLNGSKYKYSKGKYFEYV